MNYQFGKRNLNLPLLDKAIKDQAAYRKLLLYIKPDYQP